MIVLGSAFRTKLLQMHHAYVQADLSASAEELRSLRKGSLLQHMQVSTLQAFWHQLHDPRELARLLMDT